LRASAAAGATVRAGASRDQPHPEQRMSSKVYDPTGSTPPPPPPTSPPPAGSREHPFPPAASPPDPTDDDGKNPAAEAFQRIKRDVDELKAYAGHYIAAKLDGIKRTVRNIGLYAALGIVGLIAGGAIVATAAGLLIVGLAGLLGRLFGDRAWLGDIVTGLLVLGVIGIGAWWMMNKLTNTWRTQTVKKYEQRKQSQRERFGHDVPGRAAEAAATAAAERRRAAGRR
jgi:hypothetical protein